VTDTARGVLQPDLLVRDILQAGFDSLREDATPLQDVFEGRPDEELADIMAWFGEHGVDLRLGYPREAAELPGVFVTIGSSNESQQVVGSSYPDLPNVPSDAYISDRVVTWFTTQVRIMAWTLNANLTVWTQNIVQWLILGQRYTLNQQGFLEQGLNVGDFEPLPVWFPDFAYRRDTVLSGKHRALVTVPVLRIKGVTVTAQAFGGSLPVVDSVVVTRRRR